MSYGHWQLYIKLLQYIFTSMHQMSIHHNTPNLTSVIKLHFCRPYGKDLKIPFHKQSWNQNNLLRILQHGFTLLHPTKRKPRILCTHDQHTADYVRIMMEEGMDLPMGEDRAALLITEV